MSYLLFSSRNNSRISKQVVSGVDVLLKDDSGRLCLALGNTVWHPIVLV